MGSRPRALAVQKFYVFRPSANNFRKAMWDSEPDPTFRFQNALQRPLGRRHGHGNAISSGDPRGPLFGPVLAGWSVTDTQTHRQTDTHTDGGTRRPLPARARGPKNRFFSMVANGSRVPMGDHVGVFCEVVGCCSPLYARVETQKKYPVREAAPPHSNEVTGLPAAGFPL